MASLTLLLSILTTLVSLAAALPASSNANPDLEVRQTELPLWTGVYICSDADFLGNCEHRIRPLGSNNCIQLDGETTAFGPDRGISCTLFKNGLCRALDGGSLRLQFPGTPNVGPEWNDAALSYYCVEL
ncbi:hypothetical protein W97_06577 [Coniosporium apollinis CBS 100218]|uniref:Cyanovirin-N domain-containing protein n=1 Tax=Coniosporium apollinis (strain CBS 100218) TaxID=1168221 RepID=R7YZV1_CONA1|nr:uncharacterized protein W97_06577 [Coniosporium apollinis CBS 100218]EON67324.1 hypothetical protein W97_06577 [Coniosporium apollinis CBS 100218]